METKTISTIGAVFVAAVVGGVVGVKVTDTKPTPAEWSVAEGSTEWTKAVAEIARANGPETTEVACAPERVGTKDGVVLQWVCPGMGVLPAKLQAEIDKTCPDASAVKLTPTVNGSNVSYKTTCETGGTLPNTDPVPEPPKPVEAPPVVEEPVAEGEKVEPEP
jgi:hypothetical protein